MKVSRNACSVLPSCFAWALLGCLIVMQMGCSYSDPSNQTEQTDDVQPAEQINSEVDADELNASPTTDPVSSKEEIVEDVNDSRFHDALQTTASEYLQYALVNPIPNLAPADCRPATDLDADVPKPRMSVADDGGHAEKLYFLFAQNIEHYFNEVNEPSPVGQALVKESWTSKPGNPAARNLRNHASANRIIPRLTIDGKTYEIGKRNELFIMLKLDPKTEGTDEGWVYGVVEPDTKSVLAAGSVASCIACHRDQNDRLFRADQVVVFDEQVTGEEK
ncbi:MAG: cytochrome P460 family protein [Planctomycetota bacterium]